MTNGSLSVAESLCLRERIEQLVRQTVRQRGQSSEDTHRQTADFQEKSDIFRSN